MSSIDHIRKLTNTPFLNLYELDARFRDGSRAPYYVASRRKDEKCLKAATHDNSPDGVILCGFYGENREKLVLIRQYRYPIDGYVYELPAGLVEPGEDARQAGIREMEEETGLSFVPMATARPFFTSVGMTDESCATLFGVCTGIPSNARQEGTEDIQVALADRAECRRILKEENVALPCGYMMLQFLAGSDPVTLLTNEGE